MKMTKEVQAHVRILDRWYIVREGESNAACALAVNHNKGTTLLIMPAFHAAGRAIKAKGRKGKRRR